MAQLCPNLRRINLGYVGQMSTDTLNAWGKLLTRLRSLELLGPFLVRREGWLSFFKAVGTRLEELLITQSPRIDLEIVELLCSECPNLKRLRLAEIGQLSSEFFEPLAELTNLEHLEITSPGTPLNDDAVVDFLAKAGANLKTLDLSDNPELSDGILPAIAEHCPNLTALRLRETDLSDSALAEFFSTLRTAGRPGFVELDFEKGHDLEGDGLRALLAHSGRTIEKLSLMGWRHVDADSVAEIAACKQLRELDIGWCREVTDFTVKDILGGCPALREIRLWGCNQLTDRIPRRKGVRVIGIETHAI